MTIALSWSRLSDFQQCPRKFYLKYLAKAFPAENKKSIHLERGEKLHKQMETYVQARKGLMDMPMSFSPEVEKTIPLVDRFIEAFPSYYPEAQIACTPDWQPEEWYGSNVGWRAIWDFTALNSEHAFILDYKSGKIYSYTDQYGQLHLSATIAMHRFPELEYIDTAYVYMDFKHLEKVRITRDQLPELRQHFDGEFARVQAEKDFKPVANEFCCWCPATTKQCPLSRKL